MKNLIIGLTALCLLSCGKDSNGPYGPSPINVMGTVWKIVAAAVHRTTISQNPKKTVDNLYGDSASIADKGTGGFGYFNFLSFLSYDTLEIYSNMIPDRYKGTYTAQGSTISAVIDTIRHLTFTLDPYNQLLLDYPALEVHYYSPSIGMAFTRTYDSIQARDDYIATLDSEYQASSWDSLVYVTTQYYYVKQ